MPSVAASTSPMRNTSSCRRWRISTIELMTTYGGISSTSDHVAPDSRPSTHWNTSRITSLLRCRMNVCTAVANETTAIPASTSVVPERPPSPPAEPTRSADRVRDPDGDAAPSRTPPSAPGRPPNRGDAATRRRARSSRRARHRPRRRAGTGRRAGCGTRPGSWRRRSTASRRRGRRARPAACGSSTGCSTRPATRPSRPRSAGGDRSAPTAPATTAARPGRWRPRPAPPRRAGVPHRRTSPRRAGVAVMPGQLRPPGPPRRRRRDSRRHAVPSGTRRCRPSRRRCRSAPRRSRPSPVGPATVSSGLLTADRVGEEDQVGVGRHDELGVELRVAARVALRLVGDVPQPEQAVELADERRAVGAEERRVELVVQRQRHVGHRRVGDDLVDVGLHLRDEFGRLCHVSGGAPSCSIWA